MFGYMEGSAVLEWERLHNHSVVLWEGGGKMFRMGGWFTRSLEISVAQNEAPELD